MARDQALAITDMPDRFDHRLTQLPVAANEFTQACGITRQSPFNTCYVFQQQWLLRQAIENDIGADIRQQAGYQGLVCRHTTAHALGNHRGGRTDTHGLDDQFAKTFA